MSLLRPILLPPCLNTSILSPETFSHLGGQSKWSGCHSQQLWILNVESNPKPQMSVSQITSGCEVLGLWYKMARELRTPQCALTKERKNTTFFPHLDFKSHFGNFPTLRKPLPLHRIEGEMLNWWWGWYLAKVDHLSA